MNATIETALPATKSSPVNGVAFTPTAPGRGLLIIDQKRSIAEYRVTEFPADGGRGFRLAKIEGGTDRTAESYDVFLDRAHGETCDCKGFARHGHCKHVDAVQAVCDRGLLLPATKPAPAAPVVAAAKPAAIAPAAIAPAAVAEKPAPVAADTPRVASVRREYRDAAGRRAALQFDHYPAASRYPFQVRFTPIHDDMPQLFTPPTLAA